MLATFVLGKNINGSKSWIPIAGGFVLLQGLVEILRCIVCIKTGEWPARLKDAQEIDVVEQQLAAATYVDETAAREAIQKAQSIDEEAHHRLGGKGDKSLVIQFLA